MPNPKTGTVTQDVGRAVAEFKGGKVEYRTDRYGNVHVTIGKASFEPAALERNFRAVLDELQRAKPASAKGRYLQEDLGLVDHGPRHQGRHHPPAPRGRPPRLQAVRPAESAGSRFHNQSNRSPKTAGPSGDNGLAPPAEVNT